MKRYTVLIHFLIGTEVVNIYYHDVERIIYYTSNDDKITIANDEMVTDEIPLHVRLYLQGRDNNASVDGSDIISIQVMEED